MSVLDALIGARIDAVMTNDDRNELVFVTNKGLIGFDALGDCCSCSYFDTLGPLEALHGATVGAVKDVDLDDRNFRDNDNDNDWGDLTQFYGHTIITNKGNVDLVYRNESNGYYGGWIEQRPVQKKDFDKMSLVNNEDLS